LYVYDAVGGETRVTRTVRVRPLSTDCSLVPDIVNQRLTSKTSGLIQEYELTRDVSMQVLATAMAGQTIDLYTPCNGNRRRATNKDNIRAILNVLTATQPVSASGLSQLASSLKSAVASYALLDTPMMSNALKVAEHIAQGDRALPVATLAHSTVTDLAHAVNSLYAAAANPSQFAVTPTAALTNTNLNRIMSLVDRIILLTSRNMHVNQNPISFEMSFIKIQTYRWSWTITTPPTMAQQVNPCASCKDGAQFPTSYLNRADFTKPNVASTVWGAAQFMNSIYQWSPDFSGLVGNVMRLRVYEFAVDTPLQWQTSMSRSQGDLPVQLRLLVSRAVNSLPLGDTNGLRKIASCVQYNPSGKGSWDDYDPYDRKNFCKQTPGVSDVGAFYADPKICPVEKVDDIVPCDFYQAQGNTPRYDFSLEEANAGCDGIRRCPVGSANVNGACKSGGTAPLYLDAYDVSGKMMFSLDDCNSPFQRCNSPDPKYEPNERNKECMGCDGIPNSNNKFDACGVCLNMASTERNKTCMDCDGVPNGPKRYDLCGVCAGSDLCVGCDGVADSGKKWDLCGVCEGDDNTCKGCDGVPNSGKERDRCGQCLTYWPRSSQDRNWNVCLDCNNVASGGAVKDKCDVCGGNDACIGCDGVRNSNVRNDRCAICGGTDECVGCDGVVNSGLKHDRCGTCGGTDQCVDCNGVPFGDSVIDVCGKCGGNGQACMDCAGNINATSPRNFDKCGVCGGSDACVGCDGAIAGTGSKPTSNDRCGVCGGQDACVDCSGVQYASPNEPGFKKEDRCGECGGTDACVDCYGTPYGLGKLDKCGACDGTDECVGCDGVAYSGNILDPFNVCGGTGWCDGIANSRKLYDRCGVCGGADSCVDCFGVVYGTSRRDQCSVCDGYDTCLDCRNVPNGGAVYDQCGVCGGQDVCVDCFGVLYGTSRPDKCGACNGFDACVDCFGIPFGGRQYDRCGVCGGTNTCVDCFGIPFGGAVADACGVCGGRGVLDACGVCNGNNACCGCDGICNSLFSASVDRCGVCNGRDACVGCDGVPALFPQQPRALDACGVCGGFTFDARQCPGAQPQQFCPDGRTLVLQNPACLLNLVCPDGRTLVSQNTGCFAFCPDGRTPVSQGCGSFALCPDGRTFISQGCPPQFCPDGRTLISQNPGCFNNVFCPDGRTLVSQNPGCLTQTIGCDGRFGVVDKCGTCNGGDICVGCDGVAYSGVTVDACGTCGGDGQSCVGCDGRPFGAQLDQCGRCGGNNACVDCAGVPNGNAVIDVCNVCGGDGNSCKGCDGIVFSGKVVDQCGICAGTNACLDCAGVPFGNAKSDRCNVCAGTDACVDCLNIPFGPNKVDPEGTCGGAAWCDGVANSGNAYDQCGVCGGANGCVDCASIPFGTSVRDKCSVCGGTDACVDCAGVAFGTFQINSQGVCAPVAVACPVPLDACGECQGKLSCIPVVEQLEGIFAKFDLANTPLPATDAAMDEMKAQVKTDMISALSAGGSRVDATAVDVTAITAVTSRRRQSNLQVSFTLTKSSTDFGDSNSWDLYQQLQQQMADQDSVLYDGTVTKSVVPGSLSLLSAFDCNGKPVTDRAILDSGDFQRTQGGVCQLAQQTLAPRATGETRAPDQTRFPTRLPVTPTAPPVTTLVPIDRPSGETRAPDVTYPPTPATFAPLDVSTRAPEPTPATPSLAPLSTETISPQIGSEPTSDPTRPEPVPGPSPSPPGGAAGQLSIPVAGMLLLVVNVLLLNW